MSVKFSGHNKRGTGLSVSDEYTCVNDDYTWCSDGANPFYLKAWLPSALGHHSVGGKNGSDIQQGSSIPNPAPTHGASRSHDDVIKWKHFRRYWPFVRGIHRSPVNSPHKGQWRGALMFSLICVWINGWVNNLEASDLIRYRAHYDVTVMRNWHTRYLTYTLLSVHGIYFQISSIQNHIVEQGLLADERRQCM